MIAPHEHFFRCSMHTVFLRPQLRSIAVEVHWDSPSRIGRTLSTSTPSGWPRGRWDGLESALCTMSDEHAIAYLCLHLSSGWPTGGVMVTKMVTD